MKKNPTRAGELDHESFIAATGWICAAAVVVVLIVTLKSCAVNLQDNATREQLAAYQVQLLAPRQETTTTTVTTVITGRRPDAPPVTAQNPEKDSK